MAIDETTERERRRGPRHNGIPDVSQAMEQGEIEIRFQPQYGAADDALAGAEALAHWHYPEFGRIGGNALFAIATRTGAAPLLSRHVAERALAEAANWPREDLRLSLNVTATDIAQRDFAKHAMALVAASGFAPTRLTLEITEQALLNDLERARRELELLAGEGIRIALDDFGAGFCNFEYLKCLPLHYLKLDRSMVDGIASDAKDLAVLRGIIALAHALELEVIAEGIETAEQRDIIRAEGCAYYQGFLKAQPMGAEEFLRLASQ